VTLRVRRPANSLPALALLALVVVPTVAWSVAGNDRTGINVAPSQPLVALAATSSPAGGPSTASPAAASSPAVASPSPPGPAAPSASREPVVAAFAGLVPGSVNRSSLNLSVEYDVALSLNFDTRSFKVSSTMVVRNDSGALIDRLELNTIAARLGGLKLGGVSVAGKAVKATIDDQTIVVPLGGILGTGASVEVRVAYTATLRSTLTGSNWMFTRTSGIVDAYRWVPWVSRSVPFDRPNHGDPFITPVSPRIRVSITTNRALVFATSGERVAVSGLRQTFEARNVRDFAFTAAPDYKSISGTVGDTVVRVYYRSGAPASAILTAAKHAIAKMEPLVGAYPYKTYRLAQSAGGYGMESPGLTWIPTGVGTANLSYLVHHETAHQWFYGIVGSDQSREPFTDEAATDFLARHVLGLRRAARCSTARLDLSIYAYSSACYYEVIYIQGGNFLDDLRKRMGNTAFWAGLRAYVIENRFKLAATKALLDTLDDHTPLNLVPRFEPRFPRLY
jgi:hypothetical protein